MDLQRKGRVKISCDPGLDQDLRATTVENLSSAVFSHRGKYLWMGTDEFTAIERFTQSKDNKNVFDNHQRFDFKNFIDGFDDLQGEVDVEGLDYSNGYLWAIGSHSSKRKKIKAKPDKFTVKNEELKNIERQENRYLLARIAINEAGEIENSGSHQTAWLKREGSNSLLTKALATDEYLDLGRSIDPLDRDARVGQEFYFYLPSKENGFDIEGLAVWGNRLMIGLRGPVLRGMAILLEVEVDDSSSPELNLKTIGNDRRQYKRHFLDLNGLGIRELCWDNSHNSLLILAGPTMALDGRHSLFRLDRPFELADNSLSSQQNQQLTYLGDIPHREQQDRAEGLTLDRDGKSILVVYDSPAKDRSILDDFDTLIGVYADLFQLK
jgi:hypothetical protein